MKAERLSLNMTKTWNCGQRHDSSEFLTITNFSSGNIFEFMGVNTTKDVKGERIFQVG